MILDGDGFDHYGGTIGNMLTYGVNAAHGTSPSLSTARFRTGTHSLRLPSASGLDSHYVRRAIPAPARAVIGVGFALWMDTLPSQSTMRGVAFMDVNAAVIASFDLKTDGRVGVHRGDYSSTQLGLSTLPVLSAGAWNFVEFKIGRHASTGITGMRVNNEEVDGLMLTGQNTAGTANDITQIRWGDRTSETSCICYIDDYIVWDTFGDYNNDWVGDQQLLWRPPTADHATIAEFTPDSGTTLWDRIDESNPSAADYMRALVPDKQAAFEFADVPSDISDIAGTIQYDLSKKLNPGTCTLRTGMLNSGLVGFGQYQATTPDVQMTTTDTYHRTVVEENPATGLPFTPAEINASYLYMDRTA